LYVSSGHRQRTVLRSIEQDWEGLPTGPSVERPHRWTIKYHRSIDPTNKSHVTPKGTIGRSVSQTNHALPRKGPSVDRSHRRTTRYLVKSVGWSVPRSITHQPMEIHRSISLISDSRSALRMTISRLAIYINYSLRLLNSEDNQPSQAAIGRSAKRDQSAGLINIKQVSNFD